MNLCVGGNLMTPSLKSANKRPKKEMSKVKHWMTFRTFGQTLWRTFWPFHVEFVVLDDWLIVVSASKKSILQPPPNAHQSLYGLHPEIQISEPEHIRRSFYRQRKRRRHDRVRLRNSGRQECRQQMRRPVWWRKLLRVCVVFGRPSDSPLAIGTGIWTGLRLGIYAPGSSVWSGTRIKK